MNKSKKIIIYLVLFAIIVLGTFLRFANLDGQSIWVDELNHYYAAKTIIENGLPTFPSGAINDRAEIYSRMVAISFQIFGENEFGLRFPSAILGVLCIFIAYFVAKRFFNETVGLLSALFLAISPFAIGWSRLSRMYTLFQFLFMIGIYTFYLGFESNNKGFFANLQSKVLQKVRMERVGIFLQNWKLNLLWLTLSIIFFYFSYLTQQITALFYVGFMFYLLIMFLIQCKQDGFKRAYMSKYFLLFTGFGAVTLIAIILLPSLREFLSDAINYLPRGFQGTRFQKRSLYLDFIFNHYNFPMGSLFVIGVYQIFSKIHRTGIYILSIFMGNVFMFTFVFSYRHFQYLYNVYALFIIISAFAFSNIIYYEFETVKKNWFSKSRINNSILKGIIIGLFLVWIPFTPSVRLARNIPLAEDGSFNGAMYMEEWREACQYVKKHSDGNDLIISTDALETFHYLGRIDFDLNFSDLDIASEHDLKDKNGKFYDLYSGSPFLKSVDQLKELMGKNEKIWILVQHYKFFEAQIFVPLTIRKYVLANFKQMLKTKEGTVFVFYFSQNRIPVLQ